MAAAALRDMMGRRRTPSTMVRHQRITEVLRSGGASSAESMKVHTSPECRVVYPYHAKVHWSLDLRRATVLVLVLL